MTTRNQNFAAGYQQALLDIRAAERRGGWEAVQTWLLDNTRPTDDASHHGSAVEYDTPTTAAYNVDYQRELAAPQE